MKIRLLGMTPMPSTEGNLYMITYVRDNDGNHILISTAGAFHDTLITLLRICDANST